MANNQEQLVTDQMSRNKLTFAFREGCSKWGGSFLIFERKDAILIRKAEIT